MRLRPPGGFDAAATLRGGQAFLWTAGADGYEGVALGKRWTLRSDGDVVDVDVDLPRPAVRRYLGLDADYPRALARLARDPALAPAVAAHRGLRLLGQDPWEALAAFVVSANNNVPRIEGILRRLAARYGAPLGRGEARGKLEGNPREARGARVARGKREGTRVLEGDPSPSRFPRGALARLSARQDAAAHGRVRDAPRASPAIPPRFPRASLQRAFPSPEALARADLRDLRALGLGYRAPYLRATARAVAAGFPLASLARRPYPAAREALQELPGVGPKVADCVALFGLGHREAFPVDTWIRHAMARILGEGLPLAEVADAARARWGRDAGLAQQFLFHAARVEGKGGRKAPGLPQRKR